MDLPQIRWQLIRAAEAGQLVEQENVNLRQEIAALKAMLEEASKVPKATPGLDPRLVQRITALVQSHSMRTKSEVVKLKQQFVQEMTELANALAHVKSVNNQCSHYITIQENKLIDTSRDRKKLQQQLDALQKELRESDSSNGVELRIKDDIIAQLHSEVSNLQSQLQLANSAVQREREKNQAIAKEKTDAERRLQDCQGELVRAQVELEKSAQLHQQAINEAKEQNRLAVLAFEKAMSELHAENLALKDKVAALEEQIARLSSAVVGNKSHFAKYVEVKTENLALQNKLETLTKSVPAKYQQLVENKASPRLPHVHGSSDGGRRRSSMGNPTQSADDTQSVISSRPPFVPPLAVDATAGRQSSPRLHSARSVHSQFSVGQGSLDGGRYPMSVPAKPVVGQMPASRMAKSWVSSRPGIAAPPRTDAPQIAANGAGKLVI